jgi:hypothetical protein
MVPWTSNLCLYPVRIWTVCVSDTRKAMLTDSTLLHSNLVHIRKIFVFWLTYSLTHKKGTFQLFFTLSNLINSDQETVRWNKFLHTAMKWSSLSGTSTGTAIIVMAIKDCQLLLLPPDRFFTLCGLMFQLSKLLLFPAHVTSVQVQIAALHTPFTLLEYRCWYQTITELLKVTDREKKNAFCLCTGVTLWVIV